MYMKPASSASPHAIIMIGIPGAGKSTFAERFAETFQALLVSQTKLQRYYGTSEEASYELRDAILTEYIKTKRTVLIDGGADNKDIREQLVKRMKKAGYQPLIVWVQTDTAEAERRALKPYPKGSGLTLDEFNAHVDRFEAPGHRERTVVISGKHTYTSQLKMVLKHIAGSAPGSSATSQPIQPTPLTPTSGRIHSRHVTIR